MKKLCTLLAVFLISLAPLSAALLRVQTVISRYADDGKTDLIAAPNVILYSDRPARASIGNLELLVLGSGRLDTGLTVHSRLVEKIGDGKIHRIEIPSLTVESGKPASVRADDYQLTFTAWIEEPPAFDINFLGGTLSEFLATLPAKPPLVFNLVGEKTDLATKIPALSLRALTPEALTYALNKVLNPQGLSIAQSPAVSVDAYGRGRVYVLERITDPDASLRADAPRFRSYQLTDYVTEKQPIDMITDVLRTAWQMQPDAKAEDLVLKFHPGTGLLLASGPKEAITVVENIMGKLWPRARGPVSTSPAEEARRLNQVAEEVRARRLLRQASTSVTETTPAAQLDLTEQIIAEMESRRVENNDKPVVEKKTAPVPPFTTSPPRTSPPAESPEKAAERLRLVSEEVQRRRVLRESGAESPPPEPEKK